MKCLKRSSLLWFVGGNVPYYLDLVWQWSVTASCGFFNVVYAADNDTPCQKKIVPFFIYFFLKKVQSFLDTLYV